LAERVTETFGAACTFRWDQIAEVSDDVTATQLYRIAQESINNAIRHGKASRIEIRLTMTKDVLNMVVRDNGVGFSPAKITLAQPHTADEVAARTSTGIGLATMRYRANVIGGIFDIRSKPPRGTTVSVAVRLNHRPWKSVK
jgi:signal transduction histidine kinase